MRLNPRSRPQEPAGQAGQLRAVYTRADRGKPGVLHLRGDAAPAACALVAELFRPMLHSEEGGGAGDLSYCEVLGRGQVW